MGNTRKDSMVLLASALLMGTVACTLGGCSSNPESGTDSSVDLPSGWQSAKPVTGLVQIECAQAEVDFSGEGATFAPGDGKLSVSYDQAHFRCEQSVEGYFQTSKQALDIIVQPIDMNPTSVTRCDCAYGITFTVEPLDAGDWQATLFRRWDALNDSSDPVEIASELVTIQ